MKVLVVGAGPVGLTAALALASKGVSCRIVERRTRPLELSRAVGIMPGIIDALRPLGAGEAIASEAMPLRKIHLMREGRTLMRLDNTSPRYKDQVIVGLPQNRTEEIMQEALRNQGVDVAYGLAVEKVATKRKRAEVTFSDGSESSFDWVIAADGTHSSVREQLGIAYVGHDVPGQWSIADVDVAGDFDPEEVVLSVQAPGNEFSMILPIEARRARLVSSTPDALAAFSGDLTIANVRRTGLFDIAVKQAKTYHKGRVLLAGDAAHCHSPVGGKGMNLGMLDALAAVDAVITNKAARYSSERHRTGKATLKKTERARRMVTSNNPMARAALSSAAKTISTLPPVRRGFMSFLTNV